MATPNGRKTTRKTPPRKSTASKPSAKTGAKRDATSRTTTTLIAGAAAGALAAGVVGLIGLFRRGSLDPLLGRGNAEHVPTDLMTDTHPDGSERAPVDFRPDPTASIPAGERDAFRPALAGASAPTLVRGQAPELDRIDASPS